MVVKRPRCFMGVSIDGLVAAALVLGIALGGFVDGIVLHQILQWHHMISHTQYSPISLRNLEINTLADGFFHLTTWILLLVGLVMLWRQGKQHQDHWPLGVLVGGLLAGWGVFNLVEGIIDHQILGIHHVREGSQGYELAWDLAFLAFGAILLIVGWITIRLGQQAAREGDFEHGMSEQSDATQEDMARSRR
jgi:uncharacterized membrane protein